MNKAKDFKLGDTVLFDGHTCMVKKKHGKKCLAIAMPMGWHHFIPENWNDVKASPTAHLINEANIGTD